MKRFLCSGFAVLFPLLFSCGNGGSPATPASPGVSANSTAAVASTQPARITPSGLSITDIVVGTGATAASGDKVEVHYIGKLTDGTKFDSSYDRNETFKFRLGQREVIPGWDEGVAGMKVGGKRQLIVPPDLAYGAKGTPGGPIPPNATLNFQIELFSVNGQ